MEIRKVKCDKDLCLWYPNQNEPQKVFLYLDCVHETLSIEPDYEIGGAVAMSVYHGLVQRWNTPILKAEAANQLLNEVAPLAVRIIKGYQSDSKDGNTIAIFNKLAEAAIKEIENLITEYANPDTVLNPCKAKDYLYGAEGELGVQANSTDDEIADLAMECQAEAERAGFYIIETEEYLKSIRNELNSMK